MARPAPPSPVLGTAARVVFGVLGLMLPLLQARGSCCVLEDPLVAVSDVAARGGRVRLAVDAETLSSRAAMAGMDGMEEIRQETLRLTAVCGFLERVNAVVAVPLSSRAWSGGGHSSHATGFGDMDAGLRVAAWRRVDYVPHPTRWAVIRAQAIALSTGTSLPTGANDLAHEGMRLDEHAQLGTGAWGPYVGALYRLHQDPWELVASVSGRMRTTNAHGYRYARGLLAGAELQHGLLEWLSVGGGLDVRWASADAQDGAPVPNTGGGVASVLASAGATAAQGIALRVRVQVPVATRLTGDQRPGVTVAAGVQLDLR